MPYLSRDNLAVLHAECLIYFDRGLFKIPFCHINFFSRVADVFVLPWHSVLLLFFLVPLSLTLYSSKFFSFFFFFCRQGNRTLFPCVHIYIYLFYLLFQTHFFEFLHGRLCNVNIVLHTYLVYSFSDILLSTPHERPRLFFSYFLHPKLWLFTF